MQLHSLTFGAIKYQTRVVETDRELAKTTFFFINSEGLQSPGTGSPQLATQDRELAKEITNPTHHLCHVLRKLFHLDSHAINL